MIGHFFSDHLFSSSSVKRNKVLSQIKLCDQQPLMWIKKQWQGMKLLNRGRHWFIIIKNTYTEIYSNNLGSMVGLSWKIYTLLKSLWILFKPYCWSPCGYYLGWYCTVVCYDRDLIWLFFFSQQKWHQVKITHSF